MRQYTVKRNSKIFLNELNHTWEIIDRLESYLNDRGLTPDEWVKYTNANKHFITALTDLCKLNGLFDFSKN
jgi:hypothetical protein